MVSNPRPLDQRQLGYLGSAKNLKDHANLAEREAIEQGMVSLIWLLICPFLFMLSFKHYIG